MNIFLVAVLHDTALRRRTWGWYEKFEDAERAVIENHTDIFERGYYYLAVIEEMPEGVMAVPEQSWWYEATYEPDATEPVVKRTEKPESFRENFGFTFC